MTCATGPCQPSSAFVQGGGNFNGQLNAAQNQPAGGALSINGTTTNNAILSMRGGSRRHHRRHGKSKAHHKGKKYGGTLLMEAAVPVALVAANQLYSRKKSHARKSHYNKSRRNRSHRRR